ncbi:MAG: hypothetical protein ABJJ37_27130 [Roseibium sp.]
MTDALALPDPREFRQWICDVMGILEITAYRWSVQAGVPPNLISKFLSGEQHDLRLAAASGLVREAGRLAQLRGVVLPALRPDAANDPHLNGDGYDMHDEKAAAFDHTG